MRGLTLSMIVALSLGLAGCKSLEEKLERKLGIPVQINAASDDYCAHSQLRSLYREFKALKKDAQNQTAQALRDKVKLIIIEPTQVGQVVRGDLIALAYRSGSTTIARKTIQDSRTYEGDEPATRSSNENQILTIQAETKRDESIGHYYGTQYVSVYDRIESAADPLFLTSRQGGEVYLLEENAQVGISCGTVISLHDFLSLL